MDLISFLGAQSAIIVVALLVVGKIIKGSTLVNDKYIPIVLGLVGIGLMLVMRSSGVANGTLGDNIVQGILSAGVAVYGNQIVKQATKEE